MTDPHRPARGPLTGVRVIELGSTVAGPFCSRLLADFGADVIKVEQPGGDALRSMGKRKNGRSLYAASMFRNKRVASVDIRSDEGRSVAKALCDTADVVVENFRPGTLERWGLGYEDLSRSNPGVILVRISGYGQNGPYSQRPGYGVVCEAMSGIREVTGDPDRPPARAAVSMTDYITGLYGAFGAMMALFNRKETDQGQVIDAALYEAAFSFMEPHVPAYQQLGHVARRAGPRLPDHTPNSLYPTADGRYIHITAGSQSVFQRLLKAMDRLELLDDPHFATPIARSEHEDEVDATVASWTEQHRLADMEQMLLAAAIPASRIYDMHDIFDDPHYQARNMLVTARDQILGPVAMPNVVPRMSRTPGAVQWAGRSTGDDTQDVMSDVLGMSPGEIEQLMEAGVIHVPSSELSDDTTST